MGDVPLEWYRDEDHIGYDREGQKLIRKAKQKDRLDALIQRNDDESAWRTIYDEYNDEELTLSKEELQMIQRIREGHFPHVEVSWKGRHTRGLQSTHLALRGPGHKSSNNTCDPHLDGCNVRLYNPTQFHICQILIN